MRHMKNMENVENIENMENPMNTENKNLRPGQTVSFAGAEVNLVAAQAQGPAAT